MSDDASLILQCIKKRAGGTHEAYGVTVRMVTVLNHCVLIRATLTNVLTYSCKYEIIHRSIFVDTFEFEKLV